MADHNPKTPDYFAFTNDLSTYRNESSSKFESYFMDIDLGPLNHCLIMTAYADFTRTMAELFCEVWRSALGSDSGSLTYRISLIGRLLNIIGEEKIKKLTKEFKEHRNDGTVVLHSIYEKMTTPSPKTLLEIVDALFDDEISEEVNKFKQPLRDAVNEWSSMCFENMPLPSYLSAEASVGSTKTASWILIKLADLRGQLIHGDMAAEKISDEDAQCVHVVFASLANALEQTFSDFLGKSKLLTRQIVTPLPCWPGSSAKSLPMEATDPGTKKLKFDPDIEETINALMVNARKMELSGVVNTSGNETYVPTAELKQICYESAKLFPILHQKASTFQNLFAGVKIVRPGWQAHWNLKLRLSDFDKLNETNITVTVNGNRYDIPHLSIYHLSLKLACLRYRRICVDLLWDILSSKLQPNLSSSEVD